jgi:hypothetical protein
LLQAFVLGRNILVRRGHFWTCGIRADRDGARLGFLYSTLSGQDQRALHGRQASSDEMVHQDRVGTDLILAPDIDVALKFARPAIVGKSAGPLGLLDAVTSASGSSLPSSWVYQGQVVVSGRVVLRLHESTTNTGMKNLAISLDPVTVEYTGAIIHGSADDNDPVANAARR